MAPGLQIIYDSGQDASPPCTAAIDVVAVHGLNFKNNVDHARDTWAKGGGLWLRDLLPQYLPRPVRVMLFEYQSSPAMDATAIKLDDHAKTLLQWLSLKRRGSQTPLVFICHSLGGLVVKEALVEGTLDVSYKPIVEATRLLAFFATPHRGGNYASVGDVAATIIRASLRKPRNDLLNALKQNCEETTRRFEQSRHVYEKCLVISFFEGLPYGKLGIVVDKISATLNLPSTHEKQVAIHSDHSSICKFEAADPASELVLGTIAAELERATELERTKWFPAPAANLSLSGTAISPKDHEITGVFSEMINMLDQTVCIVSELQNPVLNADVTLALLTFETQLIALKTAWSKIKEWNESNVEYPHQQLVMDLDRCIACGRLLIERIHAEVLHFQLNAGSVYYSTGKFQLNLNGEGIGSIQRMIEQQTSALSWLLAACDKTILSQQQKLLENQQTREVFQRMTDDTASLLVHRDVDSLITQTATSLSTSRRSLKFDFDNSLFISRAYERWIRGSVRKVLRDQQSDSAESKEHHTSRAKTSRAIDLNLRKDSKIASKEMTILLLGSESRLDMHKLVDGHNGDWESYKPIILKNIVESAQALVNQAKDFGPVSTKVNCLQNQIQYIIGYKFQIDDLSAPAVLDQSFRDAFTSILTSPWMRELKDHNFEPNLPKGAKYFFQEIDRILRPDYVPSISDILHTTTAISGIYEKTFINDPFRYHLVDLGSQQPYIKKWFPYFDSAICIAFVVDLDAYDQYLGEPPQSELLRSLNWFRTVVNYGWKRRTCIVLLLTNAESFKKKLAHSPLEEYFANFGVKDDQHIAEISGILRRFEQALPPQLTLHRQIVEDESLSNLSLLPEIIVDYIVEGYLSFGFV